MSDVSDERPWLVHLDLRIQVRVAARNAQNAELRLVAALADGLAPELSHADWTAARIVPGATFEAPARRTDGPLTETGARVATPQDEADRRTASPSG